MDMQKLVDAMNATSMNTRTNYHVTLGRLIRLLESAPADMTIAFSGGGHPAEPHSYRGYYGDLAFEATGDAVTASSFLAICKSALGKTFQGYKGGDYVMGERTPLWQANYGNCGDAIVGAKIVGDQLVLETRDMDGE